MIGDRAKEYIVFVGLAIGGARTHQTGMWALALAAIVLQTVRHMVDTWYGALQETATRSLPVVPLDSPDRHARAAGRPLVRRRLDVGATLGRLSAAAHGQYRSFPYYLKRTRRAADRRPLAADRRHGRDFRTEDHVHRAAGRGDDRVRVRVRRPNAPRARDEDRGGAAVRHHRAARRRTRSPGPSAPSAGARCRRCRSRCRRSWPRWSRSGTRSSATVSATTRGSSSSSALLALASGLGARAKHDGPLDWLFAAALRAAEYTFIVAAGVYGGAPLPLVYTLLALLVMIHYDTSSRIEKAATPFVGAQAALGWDGRVVLLALAVALGWATVGFAVVTAIVGAVLVGGTQSSG